MVANKLKILQKLQISVQNATDLYVFY